ncbi:transposase [Micromonospora purpureochromogenes]
MWYGQFVIRGGSPADPPDDALFQRAQQGAGIAGDGQSVLVPRDSARRSRLSDNDYQANRLWSASYFAGSVGGAPLTILRQYIEQQNRPG